MRVVFGPNKGSCVSFILLYPESLLICRDAGLREISITSVVIRIVSLFTLSFASCFASLMDLQHVYATAVPFSSSSSSYFESKDNFIFDIAELTSSSLLKSLKISLRQFSANAGRSREKQAQPVSKYEKGKIIYP